MGNAKAKVLLTSALILEARIVEITENIRKTSLKDLSFLNIIIIVIRGIKHSHLYERKTINKKPVHLAGFKIVFTPTSTI